MTWRWLAAACLLVVIVDGLQRTLPSGELRDFGSFVASADAGLRGDDPYGIHPLTFHVVLPGFDVWNPNLNPPVSVLLFRAFLWAPPQQAFRWWWSLSFVCYVLTIVLLARRYRGDAWLVALWAVAVAGFWDTLALGQIYLPLVLVASGSWLLLDRGQAVAAGVLMGIVAAVKPNFAIWPVVLFLAGHWRAPLAAGVTTAGLSLLPVMTHGFTIYRQWFDVVLADERRLAFLTNSALTGLTQRLGWSHMGTAFSVTLVVLIGVWAIRQKPSPLRSSAAGIVTAIAASPIAWVHYTLFLLPVFFAARMSRSLALAAGLLVIPVWVVLRYLDAPLWQQLTIGSIYNWAVLLCLAALTDPFRSSTPAPAAAASPSPARL